LDDPAGPARVSAVVPRRTDSIEDPVAT